MNLICIDLRLFNSEQEFEYLMLNNSIKKTENINPFILFHLKGEVNKVFYNKDVDQYMFFDTQSEGIITNDEYLIPFLQSLSSIKINSFETKQEKIDFILDKISKLGKSSLSLEEIEFLNSLN